MCQTGPQLRTRGAPDSLRWEKTALLTPLEAEEALEVSEASELQAWA